MKEKEFKEKIEDYLYTEIYYALDKDDNVVIDFDEMRDRFEEQLEQLERFTDFDELQILMEEKLKQIKENKK